MLSLQMKGTAQLRGPCSGCGRGGPRALSVTPNLQRFYCFATQAHGDLIALYCHIAGLDPRDGAAEAATAIATHFGLAPNGKATVPQKPEAAAQAATPPGIGSVHGKLQFDHPNVKEWTELDPTTAEKIGIGWRQSGGNLSGRLNIPLRLQTGEPVGYIGYHPEKDPMFKVGKITIL